MKMKKHQVSLYTLIFSVIFFVLNDEHLSQVLSNILQVKERGATTIILTNLENIRNHIEAHKLDFVIEVTSGKDSYLAAL